jgi:hypothetical protein
MKNLFLFFLFLLLLQCSSNKIVFWCGDHACINKKEKESYFKKTLIIQVKEINKKNKIKYTDIEKILQQNNVSDKQKIKKDKKFAKQVYREEKIKRKIEKKLAKKAYREQKNKDKRQKKLSIKKPKLIKLGKKVEPKKTSTLSKIVSDDFSKIADTIIKKNSSKNYPDINNVPK